MSLERSYGEYPKPKGLGRSCCSHGFRREALPRRPAWCSPAVRFRSKHSKLIHRSRSGTRLAP